MRCNELGKGLIVFCLANSLGTFVAFRAEPAVEKSAELWQKSITQPAATNLDCMPTDLTLGYLKLKDIEEKSPDFEPKSPQPYRSAPENWWGERSRVLLHRENCVEREGL